MAVSGNEKDSIRLGSGYVGNLQDVYVRQQNWGSHERMAIRVISQEGAARITTPTIANALIVAGKSSPCQDCGGDPEPLEPFIMSVEGGAGGFFHNMVVTVDPYSEQDLNYCFRIDTESQSLIGSGLIVNNMIQDCAVDGVGFLAGNENGGAFDALDVLDNGTIILLEPTFRTTLAVAEIEAMLSQPMDWVTLTRPIRNQRRTSVS